MAVNVFAMAACEGPAGPEGPHGDPGFALGGTLVEKFEWLRTNAASNMAYTIALTGDEDIGPQTLSYSGKSNIYIWLTGMGGERIISLSGNGSLFTIGSGVTLILDRNVTLKGHNSNTGSLIVINSGGTLEMNTGAKITGNTGGGVYLSGGKFTMNGGDISGNTVGTGAVMESESFNAGGGVGVGSDSTFTMYGGAIHSNSANDLGGGVYVDSDGIFTMHGGTIYDNTSEFGAGVFVYKGTFAMNSGVISSNIAGWSGGGVYLYFEGNFTMNGGKISDNIAYNSGGVFINYKGNFTMNSGEISGNAAKNYGGGVGLYAGTFRMVNGTIYGTNEATESLRNIAIEEAALYNYSGKAQHGMFSGADGAWVSSGILTSTNNTIKVLNGVLQ